MTWRCRAMSELSEVVESCRFGVRGGVVDGAQLQAQIEGTDGGEHLAELCALARACFDLDEPGARDARLGGQLHLGQASRAARISDGGAEPLRGLNPPTVHDVTVPRHSRHVYERRHAEMLTSVDTLLLRRRRPDAPRHTKAATRGERNCGLDVAWPARAQAQDSGGGGDRTGWDDLGRLGSTR